MKKTKREKLTFKNIVTNSKDTNPGDLFVAIKGSRFDGHNYVEEAAKKGAAFCLVSKDVWKTRTTKIGATPIVVVGDTRLELSRLVAENYGIPSTKLKVIGITGTNGKTTVSFLLDKILSDLGFNTGVVGTVFYKIGQKKIDGERTTPDALQLNYLLHRMVEENVDYVIMEVSSHALHQKRTAHVYYDAAVFTNLTPEHLDYHGTMADYFKSKLKIFDNLKANGIAILNNDEPKTKLIRKRISGKILTYAVNKKADIVAHDIKTAINGSEFKVVTPGDKLSIKTKLIGAHNISNILSAVATAYTFGLDLKGIEKSINSFQEPPGRLESIKEGQPFKVFVDYAHTEDALEKILLALRPYTKGHLITIFGCGGDRDKTKRSRMGKVSGKYSDFTIITSDNPRSENPQVIAKEIESGIRNLKAEYRIVLDRKDAIKTGLDMARGGDIVLVAGKGHETTQVIGNKSLPFDDREVIRELLSK